MSCQSRKPLCRGSVPSQRPARGGAHLGWGEGEGGEVMQTCMLFAEVFIEEGSEFMDHGEVQIESSKDAAGTGACWGNCILARLPRSLGALVPVSLQSQRRVPWSPDITQPPSGGPPGLATVRLSA